MPPLKNIKHEKLVRRIIEKPSSNTQAYLDVYPNVQPDSARSSVTDVLAKPSVRNRITELLEAKNCGIGPITDRFKQFLSDDDEKALSWDAVKTGLKMYGAFDENDGSKSMTKIHIHVTNIGNNKTDIPQVIDTKAVNVD